MKSPESTFAKGWPDEPMAVVLSIAVPGTKGWPLPLKSGVQTRAPHAPIKARLVVSSVPVGAEKMNCALFVGMNCGDGAKGLCTKNVAPPTRVNARCVKK